MASQLRAHAARSRHRRARLTLLVGCLTLLVVGLVKVVAGFRRGGEAVPAPATCVDVAQGLPQLAELDGQVGRPIECLTMFADVTTTWQQWEDPWFLHTPYASARYAGWVRQDPSQRRLSITLAMVPSQVSSDWRAQGADGAYDRYAEALGRMLVAAGLGDSVIRLSPEANFQSGDRSIGSTPAQVHDWTRYWARLSSDLKTVQGAHFEMDWTVNAAVHPVPFASYYPGNKAVDIIGVDCYDSLASGQSIAPGPRRWKALSTQPYGLDALVAFAQAHHKPVSIPEWGDVGLSPGYGGGDDPYYVQQMAQLFDRVDLAYESYFDVDDVGTLQLTQVPKSFDVYRKLVAGTR